MTCLDEMTLAIYMYAFFYFHPDYFWAFLQIVKQETGKNSEIGYN